VLLIGITEIALLLLLGLAVGAYGTVVGVGGGFLVAPLLLLIYKLSPASAAATSLVVVFLNATSGSISYLRRGRVDLRTALVLALGTIPGALIGPFIATHAPERAFRIAFSIFLFGMAAFLFFRPEPGRPVSTVRVFDVGVITRSFTDRGGDTFTYSYSVPLALAISFGVGILSSAFGIGGGIVHVPALIYLMGLPVHIATATSQSVLTVTALTGVIGYSTGGHVVWHLAAAIGVGVIAGAQLGAAISHRVHGRWIVRILAMTVLILAIRLLG